MFKKIWPKEYTSSVSTRVSNALLVGTLVAEPGYSISDELDAGEVIGQIFVGLICDRVGRKAGLVITTVLIVIGGILATAAHGAHGSPQGLFWFMTVARGITGVVSLFSFPSRQHVLRMPRHVGHGWGVSRLLHKCE